MTGRYGHQVNPLNIICQRNIFINRVPDFLCILFFNAGFFNQVHKRLGTAINDRNFGAVDFDDGIVDAHAAQGSEDMLGGGNQRAVAVGILRTGLELIRRSLLGLLDTGLPEALREQITTILDAHRQGGVEYHALRTRQAGARRFVSFHILVPGHWTVQRGHDLLEGIEEEIRAAIPRSTVFTHLEPLEDPLSWQDIKLERPEQA